jgi:hypothetical protein
MVLYTPGMQSNSLFHYTYVIGLTVASLGFATMALLPGAGLIIVAMGGLLVLGKFIPDNILLVFMGLMLASLVLYILDTPLIYSIATATAAISGAIGVTLGHHDVS